MRSEDSFGLSPIISDYFFNAAIYDVSSITLDELHLMEIFFQRRDSFEARAANFDGLANCRANRGEIEGACGRMAANRTISRRGLRTMPLAGRLRV